MGYRRSRQEKKRLQKLYEATKNSYGSGAWYDEKKNRFIRYWASNTPGLTKSFRRLSNKRLRKQPNALNNGQYRKLFDYWWQLF